MTTLVKLQPSDNANATFEVPVDVINLSGTIKNMMEDLGEENTGLAIPLNNITTKVLEKVIKFCAHYVEKNLHKNKEDNKELTSEEQNEIDTWNNEFCSVDQPELFELILAANFLDIKPLLDATCKSVANMIKGKSPEEIRQTFNIKNDFTPEEEEQIRKENEWCEEK